MKRPTNQIHRRISNSKISSVIVLPSSDDMVLFIANQEMGPEQEIEVFFRGGLWED